MTPKRHLMKATGHSIRRAACGLANPTRYTTDPEQVTCLSCRGSLYMADLEIRMSQPAPRRRSTRKEQQ